MEHRCCGDKGIQHSFAFSIRKSKRVKGLLSRWDLRSTALSTIYTCIIIVFRHLESLTPPWSPDATPVLGVTFRVNRCVLRRHTTHHPLVESGHHELQHLGLRVRQVHTLLGVICECRIQPFILCSPEKKWRNNRLHTAEFAVHTILEVFRPSVKLLMTLNPALMNMSFIDQLQQMVNNIYKYFY